MSRGVIASLSSKLTDKAQAGLSKMNSSPKNNFIDQKLRVITWYVNLTGMVILESKLTYKGESKKPMGSFRVEITGRGFGKMFVDNMYDNYLTVICQLSFEQLSQVNVMSSINLTLTQLLK